MAIIIELLQALNTKTTGVSTADLAKELKATRETTLSQLTREKAKGNVDGNSQEGWLITDRGRGELEKGEIHPSMIDEGVTPRQQFEAIGRLIGIPEDRIVLATDIVWSGDFNDVKWVWEALGQADIAADLRSVWVNSWRAKLHKGVPPELEAALIGPGVRKEGEVETSVERKEGGKSYLLVDDMPVFVGKGLGDLYYQDAVDLAKIRAARAARSAQGAPGGQSATVGSMADEMSKVFNAVKTFIGPESKGKSYIIKPGEEGYVVEEVEEGKPTVIASPSSGSPPPSFLVDVEGNVMEAPAGRPIVIKQTPAAAPPAKTFIVRQTPEGFVTEEFEAGKPIILNAPSPGSNIPMLPYPVMGSDGQPVYDKDGKPVYANIEPMMKWMGFQSEQRRADERHGAVIGLVQTVRENLGDGIAAIKAAAEEAKKGTEAKTPASQPQVYECIDCHTKFGIPDVPFETVTCPGCKRVYTKEEVMAA